jgi:hypothetical protein
MGPSDESRCSCAGEESLKTSISWLHLTDLHLGMKEQIRLLPNIQSKFFSDLKIVHDKCGPFDLVLFTGDVVQEGDSAEFEKATAFLGQLQDLLHRLGSKNCELLVVPGNHDLQRPRGRSAVRFLTEWKDHNKDLQAEFWSDPASTYREIVNEAFRNYEQWWAGYRPQFANAGLLPGDFSYTFRKNDARIGIVGLNSAFLQLTEGDYLGRLALSPIQFNEACGGAGMDWARKHHFNFLLTHHPPNWLNPDSRDEFVSDIADPEAFVAHFCGHVHDALYQAEAMGGGLPRRCYQAKSIFGFEDYAGASLPGTISRLHGYTAGRLEVSGDSAKLTFWPRDAQFVGKLWNFVPDTKNYTLKEDHTASEPLIVSEVANHDEIEADDMARRDRSLRLTLTINGDGIVRCREVPTAVGSVQFDETIRDAIDYFVSRLMRRESDSNELKILGKLLFRVLFNGDVRTAFEQRLRRAEQMGHRPRFRLEFVNADDLARLPWEYMHYARKEGSFFLSTLAHLTLSRFMPPDQRVIDGAEHLNLLVVVGDTEQVRLELDAESILQAIPPSSSKCNPTRTALTEELKNDVHAVHFIGTNKVEGKEHKIALVGKETTDWVDEDDFVQLVTGKGIQPGIKPSGFKVPRLLFLQLWGEHSLESRMAGLAQKLISAGVPFVVASQHRLNDKVKDDAAALFARGFYESLTKNEPVDSAVQAGRNEILKSTNPLAFGTPVLYLCSDAAPLILAKQNVGRDTPKTGGAKSESAGAAIATSPDQPAERHREERHSAFIEESRLVLAAAAGGGTTVIGSRGPVGGYKLVVALKKAGLEKGKELNRERDTKDAINMMTLNADVDTIRTYLEDKIAKENDLDLLDVYVAMREVLDKGQ